MVETLAVVAGLAGFGLLAYVAYQRAVRQRSRDRLEAKPASAQNVPTESSAVESPLFRSYSWLALVAGLLLVVVLRTVWELSWTYVVALGMIGTLLLWRLEAWWQATRRLKIEAQLANALDLMISVLNSGGSVLESLQVAARETRQPLGNVFREVVGRIQFGDDPKVVMDNLRRRIPMETFELFSSALTVHWEVGGSLAPVLAAVGRTIRDRLELARRIRALTTQSRFSIGAVTAVTYFLALVVWRNDPQRMEAFVKTDTGQSLIALAMMLQAVGIVWASSMSKLKY